MNEYIRRWKEINSRFWGLQYHLTTHIFLIPESRFALLNLSTGCQEYYQKKREVEWSFGIFLVFILNFEEKSWFQWWNKTKKRLSFSNQNFIVKFFFLHIYTLICVLENYRFSPMCFYQVYISTILDYFI